MTFMKDSQRCRSSKFCPICGPIFKILINAYQIIFHFITSDVHLKIYLESHSRLSLKNESVVVPQCMKEFAITVAVWQMEFLTESLQCLRIKRSVLLLRIRNWRFSSVVLFPLRISTKREVGVAFSFFLLSSSAEIWNFT